MHNFAHKVIEDFNASNGCKSKSPIFACYIDDFNPGEDYTRIQEIDFSLHDDSDIDLYDSNSIKQYFFRRHFGELEERPINILVLDRALNIHNKTIFLGDLINDSESNNELSKLDSSNSCSFEEFIEVLRKNDTLELKLVKENNLYKAINLNIK